LLCTVSEKNRELGQLYAERLAKMDYPRGHFDRWIFWRAAGDVENAADAWERTVTAGGGYGVYLAADCLKEPAVEAGQTRFDAFAGNWSRDDPFTRLARAHVERGLPNGETLVWNLVGDLTADESPIIARHALMAFCLVCEPDEIRRRAREALRDVLPVDDIWGGVDSIRFLADEIDAATLLQRVEHRAWRASQAHFTIAMFRLAEGNRQAALEQLEKCVATNALGSFDYELGQAYLQRIRYDQSRPAGLPELSRGTRDR
jgi:hypothetical protein